MAIEVFIVESSVSQGLVYSNSGEEKRGLQTWREAKVDSFSTPKESSSQDGEDMTVFRSWCYIAVIGDLLPAREDFPDHGSECSVASAWHTCSRRFDLP